MFDRTLLGPTRRLLAPLARLAVKLGISANTLTFAGFAIGFLAMPALALGLFPVGLALILANRLLDGLDGAVARLTEPTDRGAFLDIALDFFFYATVPFAFALHDPGANALAAAFLILAFVGTGSSFLAFAVIAAKRGLAITDYPGKGIHFLGGLTEGAETIAFFSLICLWPQAFAPLAVLFALACLITTGFRWYWGWKTFAEPANLR
ncbi:MAG TPA: CDP-alcohol phosphatidyltransferase family protein [Rhabdaerophilum sp.]|nr:CDP-alcohol phosphatidyltransferase family protein [Rhabdaerophilum sp.]